MIYITGDTHADFHRFSKYNFPEQNELTENDTMIILGDFGGIWCNDPNARWRFGVANIPEENYWLDWLNDKPYVTCFVDGNHENYGRLYSDEFPIVDFHGGKAHEIRDKVFHLMRGYVFDFDGKKCFVMGGASSHDIKDGIMEMEDYKDRRGFVNAYNRRQAQGKYFRVNKMSWWEREIPTEEEFERGKQNLEKCGYKVDYVFTHTFPHSICSLVGFYDADAVEKYLDELLDNGLEFKEWHGGHLHFTGRALAPKFYCHFKEIIPLVEPYE